MVAIEPGLDDISNDDFQHQEQAEYQGRLAPSGKDGESHRHGEHGRDRSPDIGNETQQAGENSPEQGVRYSKPIGSNSENRAVDDVDNELQQQVAAQAARAVVQCSRHDAQVTLTGETDDTIPKVLALDHHKKREDNHH